MLSLCQVIVYHYKLWGEFNVEEHKNSGAGITVVVSSSNSDKVYRNVGQH